MIDLLENLLPIAEFSADQTQSVIIYSILLLGLFLLFHIINFYILFTENNFSHGIFIAIVYIFLNLVFQSFLIYFSLLLHIGVFIAFLIMYNVACVVKAVVDGEENDERVVGLFGIMGLVKYKIEKINEKKVQMNTWKHNYNNVKEL